jgi:ectoine hydroxylase-related dioxygenase (phytanoyl-CoA dioxygenase family)
MEPELFDESTAKDDVLEAGQLSLHDVYLIHGSPANRSTKRRAGLALRYMPTTSHFDRSIPSDGAADFARRPIFLVRGVDRCGKNEYRLGNPGA